MPPATDSVTMPPAVTIPLGGILDANAGVELLASVSRHVEAGANRIDIDLMGVDDWTPEGARALRRCRRIARTLAGGLHYRTGPGAGHDALLEAFADDGSEADDDVEADAEAAPGSDPA